MEEVTLLQYNHGVPDMHMTEVYSNFGMCRCPTTTPLNWAVPRPGPCQEYHPVSSGIVNPTFPISLLYWKSVRHTMLRLEVHIYLTPYQVFLALGEANLIPVYLLVVPPHPRHPPGIDFV